LAKAPTSVVTSRVEGPVDAANATTLPHAPDAAGFRDAAAADNKALPVHGWVPWIAGYSAPFVDDVFDHYLAAVDNPTILDPFAGVGTTLVAAQHRGWESIGFEINAYAALASRTKLAASNLDPVALSNTISEYEETVGELEELLDDGSLIGRGPRSTPPPGFRSRQAFYSERVLPKVLFTLDFIDDLADATLADLMRLAFASVMVSFSNYTYEPSLGSRPGAGKPLMENASVVAAVGRKLHAMLDDVAWLHEQGATLGRSMVHERSFFEAREVLKPASVDLLLTSPPYLNNYHYVRNTRPQMYWLGFAKSHADLRRLEETNFGKFWQTVREGKRIDLDFSHPELERSLDEIRSLRLDKGIYGGGGWANYATTYYNDCARFVSIVSEVLRPGGVAVVVVGNSLLQGVELKVERHLGQIGEMHGLVTEDIHIVREKRVGSSIVNTGARSDAGAKVRLYDAATVLRKPG
jgi:hypothetical protein